jgi:hypothetical protein
MPDTDSGRPDPTDVTDVTDVTDEPGDSVDVPDDSTGPADVDDPGDTPDGPETGDIRQDTDVAPADADAQDGATETGGPGRVPGTLPLRDWLGCDVDVDCPNGSGNCITTLPLNRVLPDGRSTIPLRDVFPGLETRGVCTLSCATGTDPCGPLGLEADPAPWTCQLVYVGSPTYPAADDAGPLPLDPLPNASEMQSGVPFGGLCRPPFERSRFYPPDFCQACRDDLACEAGSACVLPAAGAADGSCRVPCEESGDCPLGFDCRALDSGSEAWLSGDTESLYCAPALGTCGSCRDADVDRRGIGRCGTGGNSSAEDCDDTDPLVYFDASNPAHAFPGSCGPDRDANCNGIADDVEQVGTAAWGADHCRSCGDVCRGSAPQASSFACEASDGGANVCVPVCDDPTAFVDCNGDPADGCEVAVTDPSRLYTPDCDGDGFGAIVASATFDCAGDGALRIPSPVNPAVSCASVAAVAGADATWGDDCNDSETAISPGGTEICDTIDNDCDGEVDPDSLFNLGGSCTPGPEVLGECRGTATLVCAADGGTACSGGPPLTELCDGLDNDCDGTVDNLTGDEPGNVVGESCRFSDEPGACGEGTWQCRGSAGVICERNPVPSVDPPGDRVDANCDGFDGELENALFVRVGGATGFADDLGSRTNPVGTLARASQLMWTRLGDGRPVTQLFLASGTYEQPHQWEITADRPLTIVGGMETGGPGSDVWAYSASGRSEVSFGGICGCSPTFSPATNTCIPVPCQNPEAAIRVLGPVGIRLQQLNLVVPVQAPGFGHAIGVRCERSGDRGCSGLTLDRVTIEMEGGAPGQPYSSAAAAGANGSQGTWENPELPGAPRVPAGGRSFCSAAGGNGGSISSSRCRLIGNIDAVNGVTGASGSPSGLGGAGGAGGGFSSGACTSVFAPGVGSRGRSQTSTSGASGGAGSSPTPLSVSGGTGGSSGSAGGGGGGGGGTAGVSDLGTTPGFGGPGASGGCGGTGGAAGQPGGSVFGVWIEDRSESPVMQNVTIQVGPGGAGGDGQAGGIGGTGGPFSSANPSLSTAAVGGPGGHGSGGGGGGGGGGGWSIGIARFAEVAVSVVPTVGGGGPGGQGGEGGPSNNEAITPVPGAAPVQDASRAGARGPAGPAGQAARYCNLGTTAVGGEPLCR